MFTNFQFPSFQPFWFFYLSKIRFSRLAINKNVLKHFFFLMFHFSHLLGIIPMVYERMEKHFSRDIILTCASLKKHTNQRERVARCCRWFILARYSLKVTSMCIFHAEIMSDNKCCYSKREWIGLNDLLHARQRANVWNCAELELTLMSRWKFTERCTITSQHCSKAKLDLIYWWILNFKRSESGLCCIFIFINIEKVLIEREKWLKGEAEKIVYLDNSGAFRSAQSD